MFKKTIEKLGIVRVLLLASFIVGLLFFGSYVFSVSAETKNAGPLKIEYPGTDPLFSATNIAPGYTESKTLTVTNQGSVPHSFAIAVSGSLGSLADVLHIAPKVLGNPVWDKTLTQIAQDPNSDTIIGSIAPGGVETVDLLAYLPGSVGNDYQDATTMTFDFIVGDQEPEPTVSILPSPSSSPGGTGGGVVDAATTGTVGETLGVSTSPSPSESVSPSPSPSGTVSGEKNERQGTETQGKNYRYLYWLIPILVILIILFLLWWRRRRRDEEEEQL